MSSFTEPIENLQVSPLGDGKTWILRTPFSYYLKNPDGERVEVPALRETDFASVPRLFWTILPPWGKYGKAAILHDFLYGSKIYSRKKADQIMRDAMRVLKTPEWQVFLIYWNLRAFGWWGWFKVSKKIKLLFLKIPFGLK